MGWLCIQLGLGDGVAGVPPFLLVVVVAGRGGGNGSCRHCLTSVRFVAALLYLVFPFASWGIYTNLIVSVPGFSYLLATIKGYSETGLL